MADFRKLFYALALVAVLVGLSVPASAQSGAVTCNAFTTPTLARAEGYAELVGDYIMQCTGGTPTPPGQAVPSVNITVFLSTNITSKLTASSTSVFDEALLLIDEPNSQTNPTRPILNCGNYSATFVGAPDNGPSGPGVCEIVAPSSNTATYPGLSNPAATYDGTPGVQGASVNGNGTFGFNCDGAANAAFPGNQPTGPVFLNPAGTDPAANQYGCGRPNVFQGRLGTAQNTGQNSIVVFAGVPFDPPGTVTTRTLRITNVRADAEFLGVTSTFTQTSILMSVSFTGTTFVQVNNFSGQQLTVATVLRGLSIANDGKGDVAVPQLGFLQCLSENLNLFLGKSTTGDNRIDGYAQPQVTFVEGFQNAWKTKNVSFLQTNIVPNTGGTVGNGTFSSGAVQYNNTINYPGDLAQNATGSNYNTESGWEWVATGAGQKLGSAQAVPVPNPPQAVGTIAVSSNGYGLYDANGTGISSAGVASQGTRLALNFSNQPQGISIFVPPVVFLVNSLTGNTTGVMVLTATAADGSGTFAPPSGITAGGASNGKTGSSNPASANFFNPTVGTNALVQVSNNLAVWEILFSDPNSIETTTVPVVVAYAANLSANPPIGLPVPGQVEQVAASFAPFYSTSTARQPSYTLPVPRFIPSNAPLNIIEVVKCACDILFPFVAATSGFDTGIAIANTSLDPGAAYGFGAVPQQGTVTFFYYGTGANGAQPPPSQTSAVVPAGQVLTYVLSSGGGAIGTNANGLDNRANGFEGYIIAQAGFQFCHAYAFISPIGGGPTSSGVSEGYLGIILDNATITRTAQNAEIKAH